MKIGDAAIGFDRTRQTIRNWIANPDLAEFFSEQAKRETGKGYSELLANDLEVCNSIVTMLGQKASFGQIAEKLGTGWRDYEFPDRLLFLANGDDMPENSARLMASRAIAEQKSSDLMEVVRERDARIAELEKRLDESRHELEAKLEASHYEREKLLREIGQLREEKASALSKLENEIDLWRSGRLKPLKGQGSK